MFATGGMLLAAACFGLLMTLPVNFVYWHFALILLLMGIATGLFGSPNNAAIMNSVPPEHRGVGSGMRSAFLNVGSAALERCVFHFNDDRASARIIPVAMYAG